MHPGPHSMFLIFPRPLVLDPQTRIIGINYALAEQPEVKGPVVVPELQRKTKAPPKAKLKRLPEFKPEPPPPPKPAKKTFTVRIRRTATLEETRQIEAENRAEAERRTLEEVRAAPFVLSKAQVREEVVE